MTETNAEKYKTKTIKKYKNRKLYDPEASHYITLSSIKEFIVQGQKVVVKEDPAVKGNPEKDITVLTKIQIIQDEAQKKHNAGQLIDFVSEAELDAIIKRMKKSEATALEVPAEPVVMPANTSQVAGQL